TGFGHAPKLPWFKKAMSGRRRNWSPAPGHGKPKEGSFITFCTSIIPYKFAEHIREVPLTRPPLRSYPSLPQGERGSKKGRDKWGTPPYPRQGDPCTPFLDELAAGGVTNIPGASGHGW